MIFQVFIPTAIMVALSWFSFLLPKTSHPGRVGTLVTLILVLIQINVMVVHESPVLSGLCGLTVWTTICLCMVGYLKHLPDIYLVLRIKKKTKIIILIYLALIVLLLVNTNT